MNGLFHASSFVAYIDGGSGSMAIQVLLASVFASMYGLKNAWTKFKMSALKKADNRVSDAS